jgi:predicted PurR-regulated permease PerM
VESYQLTPLVQERTVALPPALTITAQVLLGILLRALGVILATPLVVAALVLVQMLY